MFMKVSNCLKCNSNKYAKGLCKINKFSIFKSRIMKPLYSFKELCLLIQESDMEALRVIDTILFQLGEKYRYPLIELRFICDLMASKLTVLK